MHLSTIEKRNYLIGFAFIIFMVASATLQWNPNKNILKYLDNSPIFVQYPYDSFRVFINYLEADVNDPKTSKICITIYRTE